ncbi:hypothetical protein [Mesorhizobium loti]|uniref:hypothetical protein n=1 Tax=Rhizobium loti TaxID=381 RepID=UPI00040C2DE9|nr:hypothetical protein [Mesorhizobium loti]
MTPLQKVIFLTGDAVAIALASTVSVLILERVLPGYPNLTMVGPLLCAGSALIFCKWFYGRL